MNLTQLMVYPINIFMMLFIVCCLLQLFHIVVFLLFGTSKELITDSKGLQFRNFVRLEQKTQENISKNHSLLRRIRKAKVNIISAIQSRLV